MVTKRGKVVHTGGVSLPEGTIADIEDSYKYLGIPQANGNLEQATRKAATAKYLQRVRQVLRSQLNGKNKTRAINSYALPVIRYPAGIIRWPKEEIQTTDVKTRKLLTMHGGFHPKSSTLRLYASRKEGGRGLVSVEATIQDETSKMHEYIKLKAPTDSVLSECLRQWRAEDTVLEDRSSWEDKPLHWMSHRTITEVADINKSYQWLERAGLQDSTEALILAAQEQALSTRAIEAQIYHTRQDPRCRLCKEAPETIQHITAGCKMLAGKAYMERHNQVAGIIYRNMCAEYGLETPRSKWETPPKVVENERAKILWDFQIQTDRMVMANQPDIVVVDKEQRKAVTVVPVVIGALGAVTPKLEEWLQQIPGKTSDLLVQKSAVLGTAKILRRTLKLPGLCRETRHQREKSTAKVKRKYHSDYIQFRLFWNREEEDPKPHCVLGYETLANEAMKPAKLKRHLETKHKEYQGKPIGVFERKRDELKKHMMKETSQIPLSNDTVQRRMKAMAESVELQLVTRLRQSQFFSLELDESIDLGNEAHLLCFVRYIYAAGLHDEFLFCRSLPTNTTGEAIFHSLNDLIVKNNLDWSRCVGIAPTRAVAPSAAATHCCIHREQLALKKMPQCLKSVLDESVKIVNKIKAKPLNSRLFKAVCEEMGSEHTKLFHTEVRWLSGGKVLTRLFELRDEVMLFLHHSDELYDRMHDFHWLAKLAYLADIFSTLNTLNVALQGKTVTIFNVQDKIKATRLKMEFTVASFKQHLLDLHLQRGIYFPELDASFDWIRNPFGDKTHIEQFTSKLSPREVDSLTEFWFHIQPEHPQLAGSALKLLMPFPTTYNCEVGFSTLVGLKTKQLNWDSVEMDCWP
uniref:HAT C-terminal dimerisation domain-containing protein n=1 Tax=Oryzias latipes TaxID=8090 RepID=A0A3B3HDB2_ORYLA